MNISKLGLGKFQWRDLCIDETIIPFKGCSSLKQYIPKKPHKWGFKLFVLADKNGIVYDFIPYTGKIEPVNKITLIFLTLDPAQI